MSESELDAICENLLVLRAQSRDAGAFQQLVVNYERRLLYYVHRLLGSEVDRSDVLQEIWLKVFLGIGALRAPQAFRVWLYKIAHDVAISQLRKNSRREPTTPLADVQADDAASPSDWNELELLEHADLVHDALGKLSLPHREVLTLRFLEDLELAEIAEIVGCNVGTVKSRLHYAKSALRTLLEATYRE